MMPLIHSIRKCTAGSKLSKSQEKINHWTHERHQTVCKNEKKTGNPNTDSENIVKI